MYDIDDIHSEIDYFKSGTIWLQRFLSIFLIVVGIGKLFATGLIDPNSDEDLFSLAHMMGLLWLVFGLLFLFTFFREGKPR